MPHIRTVFPDDQKVRELLKRHGETILGIVANELGYETKDVAMIPEVIREEDKELLVNPLPLEFVIDSGSRAATKAQNHADNLVNKLAELDGFADLEFGVWLRPMVDSRFAGSNIG